jgi:hypothetical protein
VLPGATTASVPGQEKAELLHEPIDPLGIDGRKAGGAAFTPEKRSDPPISIGWPGIDQAPDLGAKFEVTVPGLSVPVWAVIVSPARRHSIERRPACP